MKDSSTTSYNFCLFCLFRLSFMTGSFIYSKTAKLWKSGAALKRLGEKSWEIKGSGQEWLQWC